MANPEHLAILKRGVEEWNWWRACNREIRPDLSWAELSGAELGGANLDYANLQDANLSRANLSRAYLRWTQLHGSYGANLSYADLNYADLSYATLADADFSYANLSDAKLVTSHLGTADLSDAKLVRAHLDYAQLNHAYLINTCLVEASLIEADLSDAHLKDTDLSNAVVRSTTFARMDLREAKGLAEIKHEGPSYVELHSIQLPQDVSALHFLRSAGIPDEYIGFWRSTMMYPIHYHSCFISYSSKDQDFAKRLHADLQDHGVHCWFAPHDMKIGDKIRSRIDEAIHMHDKLLLLLSEHALASSWVEDEIEAAFAKEREQKREVLFPVRLDDAVMQNSQAWMKKLRHTRHIGDFTNCTNPQAYQQAFERLLRDLKAQS